MNQINKLKELIEQSDAILIGAGSGMSAAGGLRSFYEHDEEYIKNYSDFEQKYGFQNTFDGYYYRYPTSEERWAFIARSITTILNSKTGTPYFDIKKILEGKNYHILTTNQDTQFTRLFPEEKISAIQGDWRYLQCRHRCHDALYDAVEPMKLANESIDNDVKIPSELIPRCPKCGGEMEPWVRGYDFLEGTKYREEHAKVQDFIQKNQDKKILFWELGVGRMTPMFIQEPFWNLTYHLPNAHYVTINPKDALVPKEIENRSLAVKEDITDVLSKLAKKLENIKDDM